MKATGIVRRIDDLGRVVIPKEIRRTLRIREGDPLEIYTEKDGEVIFKKYSPMGELSSYAAEICESLYKSTGGTVAVCDRDSMIAVSGGGKKELLENLSAKRWRRSWKTAAPCARNRAARAPRPVESAEDHAIAVAAPILAEGDVLGCVMFLSHPGSPAATDLEFKLAQTVAGFLGRQMEG